MSGPRSRLAVALLAALAPLGAPGSFDEGLESYRTGLFGKAFDTWRICARRGVPACQYGLGVLYQEGGGVPRDTRRAAHWYEQAALNEHPEAMVQLGFLYAIGSEDVDQSAAKAWAWFSRAAALGVEGAAAHRDRIGQLLTAEERREAQRLADQLSIRYHLQKK